MILWDVDSEDSTSRYAAGDALAEILRQRIRRKIEQDESEILVLFHDIKQGTQENLDSYLISMYEGAQDAGKIAVFPTSTAELNDFLKRY
jgi:3-dehydroquinate dehydratase